MNGSTSRVHETRPIGSVTATRGGRKADVGWTIVAALVYAIASIALTWPLVLDFSGQLFGDYGDTRGHAWGLWAKAHGFLEGSVSHLLAAPFGFPLPRVVSQPLSEWPLLTLARACNEIAALNSLSIAAFPITATTTFVFLDRLLQDRAAAFFGGFAFGFCPAAVMQAVGGHAEYALNVFVSIALLALFRNARKRSLSSAALVGAVFGAIALTSLYIGYFALFLGLFFAVFDLLTAMPEQRSTIVRNYVACAAIAAIIFVPAEYHAFQQLLGVPAEVNVKSGYIRSFSDLEAFSARPWEYFVPSIDHPVWGRYVESFTRAHLHGSNAFEQTLYLGAVPLTCLAIGVVMLVRRKFDADLRPIFQLFACAAGWMFFLSMPPRIGDSVPTISYFAYGIAPMFRVYARSGIFVALLTACGAAVVLAQLSRRMAPKASRVSMLGIMVAIAFDFWSIPPSLAMRVDKPPAVYEWLAKQPGSGIVAEYPMISFDEASFYTFLFWQRVHGKPLVNGASPDNERAWDFYQTVRDLSDPRTPALLKSAGVEYILVHKAMYREGPIPGPLKRYYQPARAALGFGPAPETFPPEVKLERTFGEDSVYLLR